MSEDSIWGVLKERRNKYKTIRERRAEEFAKNYDKDRWRKCSDYHYQTQAGGRLLDYWPTRNKWRHDGVTYHGSWAELEKFLGERNNR